MLISKHQKLVRKLLGMLARPRIGVKNNLVKVAKFSYLLVSEALEIVGDTLFFRRNRSAVTLAAPQHILIVKIDQLGDVLFSTLLLPAIKRKYPQAKIDYLVRPGGRHVIGQNPYISEIYEWHNFVLELLPGRGNRSRLLTRWRENRRVINLLRANCYDVVINARAYPPSSNSLLRSFGKKLIAFDISEQSFLADAWAPYDLDAEEWENYAHLLAPLGIEASAVGQSPEFYSYDAPNPMPAGEPYVVISPVSFDADRQWSEQHWTDLVEELVRMGLSVACTGIPAQRAYLEQIASPRSNAGVSVYVFADMSLPEFGSLIEGATAFVGIDSFPAHLAFALKKQAAILINPAVYYLKGISPKRFANEARCMLPRTSQIGFFDIRSAHPAEIAAFCETAALASSYLEPTF